ncbi:MULTISPECIES: hypothetical protein [Sphingomonas]|uniref:UrcA family protein n=1 Tax=Sphingomonas molluscorum TaxID=418184 RepID=A0ABU8Q768_9SPHN|nr:hypothetical protein [Sphingomonas sp. JUb134]MBM7406925.1 hypothetical protein [Sphingomonas sp. JUb134]
MRQFFAGIIVGSVFASAPIAASTLLGPKGSFSTFLTRLEYDPSRACDKPRRPYLSSSEDRVAYLRRRSTYLDCIKSAASDDISYASEVVVEGYEKALEERF